MKEIEYEVMNELYFVCSWQELASNLPEIEEGTLVLVLKELVEKAWVDCMWRDRGEFERIAWGEKPYDVCSFLCTRKGLLALHVE